MYNNPITNFFLIGISYKKSDADTRGAFSVNEVQYGGLLDQAISFNLNEVFVLSTCNRTEVYGFAPDPETIIRLFANSVKGSLHHLRRQIYIRKNKSAINHFFQVAAGLDSQILGDADIIFQIKQAAQFAKKRCFLGAFTERLINEVLACSKKVKNQTTISDGITSTSYAAVQYLEQNIAGLASRKITVVGAGKIGKNICRYLCKSARPENIFLLNRTREKAESISKELHIQSLDLLTLPQQVLKSDVIILAISAHDLILTPLFFKGVDSERFIMDLSIPSVVDYRVQQLKNVHFLNVDSLSNVKDHTLKARVNQIPEAQIIIRQHVVQFLEWNQKRKFVPYLKMVKTTLHKINLDRERGHMTPSNEELNILVCDVQKEITQLAKKMEGNPNLGCCCIETISSYLKNNKIKMAEVVEV